eukprot:5775089-Pyramimonas_sp.AAC.1
MGEGHAVGELINNYEVVLRAAADLQRDWRRATCDKLVCTSWASLCSLMMPLGPDGLDPGRADRPFAR